jgi:hypothetical protein
MLADMIVHAWASPEEILQQAPMAAFFCISTNAPIFVSTSMVQP